MLGNKSGNLVYKCSRLISKEHLRFHAVHLLCWTVQIGFGQNTRCFCACLIFRAENSWKNGDSVSTRAVFSNLHDLMGARGDNPSGMQNSKSVQNLSVCIREAITTLLKKGMTSKFIIQFLLQGPLCNWRMRSSLVC